MRNMEQYKKVREFIDSNGEILETLNKDLVEEIKRVVENHQKRLVNTLGTGFCQAKYFNISCFQAFLAFSHGAIHSDNSGIAVVSSVDFIEGLVKEIEQGRDQFNKIPEMN